ncbi:MAG TPA: hypothetical protein VHA75_08470, partial [Rugosimonospora sp.]|nr:hypothetical protein [Rugosimonospora sp.]
HNVLEPYFKWLVGEYQWVWGLIKDFAGFWYDVWINKVGGAIVKVGGVFKSIFQAIGGYISGAFHDAVNVAKSAINTLIGLINKAVGFINSHIVDNANKIPGVNFPHLPTIPMLATGGLITHGGMAIVGENGPEMVSLPTGAQVYRNGTQPSGTQTVVLEIRSDGTGLGDFLAEILRRTVRQQGGNGAVLGISTV